MADRGGESVTTLLAPPALRSLAADIAAFTPGSRERGRRYAAQGHVGAMNFDGSGIYATVYGTVEYDTSWEWIEGEWIPDCTCPMAPYCKHAYALACCVLAYDGAVPDAVAMRSRQRQPRKPVVATARPSALQRLRAGYDAWDRQQALHQLFQGVPPGKFSIHTTSFSDILQESDPDLLCWRLAAEIPKHTAGWLPPALKPFRDRPDLVARFGERARVALARELVEWASQQRRAPQRALRLLCALEPDAVGRLGITLEARLTTPRLSDAPRNITQLTQLRSEIRRTPGILPPDQAGLLEWLVDQRTNGSGGYSASGSRLTTTALKSLLDRFANSALVTWSTNLTPEAAARGGVTPGDPLQVCPDPARLLPACLSHGEAVNIELRFLWSDGTTRRLDEAVHLHTDHDWSRVHPSFVLADGRFSFIVEEPPESLRHQFYAASVLQLPRTEWSEIGALLASSFPHLRPTFAAHTRFHRVRPVVALDLRDDDWMQFRCFAHSGGEAWQPTDRDDTVVFEYAPERGWIRRQPLAPVAATSPAELAYEGIADGREVPAALVTSAPAINPGAPALPPDDQDEGGATDKGAAGDEGAALNDLWMEAPDPQTVEAVVEWLGRTQAVPGAKATSGGRQPAWDDRTVGWWMAASRKRMEAFADAWEQRPAGVTYLGTPRVRRLLSGVDRITPRLRIESSGVDWFAISAEWEAEGLRLTDDDLGKLRAATTRFVRLPSGWVRRDVGGVHDETAQLLADLGVEPGQGEQRLTLWQLGGAKPETLRALEHLGADAEAMQALARLRERVRQFSGLPPIAPPAALTAQLRPYQQQGLDFLAYTTSLGLGTVLADDMGLGKTVQALAWLEHLREQDPDGGPCLVVCPASVVHNWAREAERFAPGLRVLLLTSGKLRHSLRREIASYDLIVTNYALLRRDIEAWRTIELRAAILDEAQNIKNPDAIVTRAALALRAGHRLALTGTPLENRALDLWSIVSFVNPGYLGNRTQFSARFDRVDAPPHCRTLLAAKLRPVLLRRTKKEVAPDLPERIEERHDCELSKEQRQLYLAELKRSRAVIERLSDGAGGVTQHKITILAALTRLRQICCHPALVGGKPDLESGKFEALFELLEPVLAEGHKVLVFSQFVRCLRLLSAQMTERGIVHHMLTGQTVKRERVVAGFQDDPHPCVFLISLKAGGTGLNLTAASYVVVFDPWWNPAVEAQAIDRTHRIGQDRTVIAYRMLTRGTIEEKIWELQQRKAALAQDVLGEDGFARTLTRDDLAYLLDET